MPTHKEEKSRDGLKHPPSSIAHQYAAWLAELYPECVSEGKIDFEKLRAALGDEVDARPERYAFTWAGKRDALRLLQTPSRATLLPCPAESLLPEGRQYSQASDPLGPFVSLRGSNFLVDGANRHA